MRPNQWLTGCLLTAALGLLGGCDRSGAPAGTTPPPPPEVGVIVVKPQEVALHVELPGRTSASLVAEVRPQVTGIVRDRLFDEGMTVSAGQPLYQIDPDTYEAAVASAEATLARAEAAATTAKLRAERVTALVERKLASQQDLDDTEAAQRQTIAEVAQQRALLQSARIDLRRTRITAPISGRIGKSDVTAGALVTSGQERALATVQQLDPMFVDITRSSQELLQLREELDSGRLQRAGDNAAEVTLVLEDGSRYTLPGRLAFSDVTIDPGTASVTLRAVFPNPGQLLLPGMYVRAVLADGERRNAILVPQAAVLRNSNGSASVMIVDSEQTVILRPVDVSRSIGSQWLVESGLEPGEHVIVDGLQKARPGSRVVAVIRNADQTALASGAAN